VLLDSNILIYAANQPTPEINALVTSVDNSIASVTQIEVYGFRDLGADEKKALDTVFARLKIHSLDNAVIEKAIGLRQGRAMGIADAIIAATALVNNLPLVTRNTADFKGIPGLRLIDPFA
jgi:predicted nucleic acid-binding protein